MEQRKEVVLIITKSFCSLDLNGTCKFAGVSRSCVYYQNKHPNLIKRPGKPPPGFTKNRDGTLILDQTIISILKKYRSSPMFLNGGGYYKLTQYLRIEQSMYVNHKKVYRICNEQHLLLYKQASIHQRKFRKKRCEYLEITKPNQLWQFDLKYVWIQGESRWCFLLSFIDVMSKKITGYYIGKTCKAGDLVFTLNEALLNEGITSDSGLVIRSDNGPQMSSNKFHFYLKRLEQKLSHEFIPPRTPDRNAYIEAFHSIIEAELIQARYFKNYEETYRALVEFIQFYNVRRLHGSIGYLSPIMFLNGIKNGSIAAKSLRV